MARSQFASLRNLTPGVSISAMAGGNLSAGSGYFWINTRSRMGWNQLSDGAATPTTSGVFVSWSSGQKVSIVIGATAVEDGEDPYEFAIAIANTDDVTTAERIASIRYRDAVTVNTVTYPGQGTEKTLPIVIELTEDAHVTTGTVADGTALPIGADLIHGMIRFITADGLYYQWDDEAEDGVYPSTGGYWVVHPEGFGQYVASTDQPIILGTQPQGCDYLINALDGAQPEQGNYVLQSPAYDSESGVLQDASYSPIFWISNGLVPGVGSPLPSGDRIAFKFFVDGLNQSSTFSSQAQATLLGKVNRATGILDTGFSGVGSPVVLQPTSVNTSVGALITPADLSLGEAWAYRLQLNIDSTILGTKAIESSQIAVYPVDEGRFSEPAPWAVDQGEGIKAVLDRFLCTPLQSGFIQVGSGQANVVDVPNNAGYAPRSNVSQTPVGFATNTAGQYVVINGPQAGDVFVRPNLSAVEDYEGVVGVISTLSGTFTASSYTTSQAIAGNTESLQVQINYSDEVRVDYPDSRLAGNINGEFSPKTFRVYVRFGGTIYENPSQVNTTGSPQNYTITDITGWTVVGSLPDSSGTPTFGLFDYGALNPSAISQASNLAAGNYEVAIAWEYDGTIASAISHATGDGVLPVFALTNAQLQAAAGQSGFTVTTANFTQPAVGSSVTIDVEVSNWVSVGQTLFIENGGFYSVLSVPSDTTIQINNSGGNANAPISTVISSPARVSPGGVAGASAYGFNFTFDSAITSGPATGELRFNNASVDLASELYIHETDADNFDISSLLDVFEIQSKLVVRNQDNTAIANLSVTGAIVDNGADRTVPISCDSCVGTFSDGERVFFTGAIAGQKGDAGDAATITAGVTTTGAPGTNAFVSNSGTSSAAIFDFTIPKGAAGVPFGTRHTFDTGTGNDPATGELRFNNATISSATEIYINETDRDSLDVSTVLNNIPDGSRISVVDDGDASAIAYFSVTSSSSAASVTTLVVTHLAGNPTIADGVDVTLQTEGKGDTGATGTPGSAGVDAGLPYEFDSGTTAGALSGEIRLNNIAPASVTQLFINVNDRNAVDQTAFWDSVNADTIIQIQSQVLATTYALYQITGQAGTTERTFNVTHLGSNGTLADADNVGLAFFLKGDPGTNGTNGTDGADGTDAGVPYEFDTAVTSGTATGELRFNNAAVGSTTTIYVNGSDRNSANLQPFWDEVNDDSVVFIQSQDNASNYALFRVDSQSGTTERTLTVTYLANNGSFADAESLGVVASFSGPTGPPGEVTYGAITVEEITGTTHTVVLANRGKFLQTTNASAVTITLPSSWPGVIGDQMVFKQKGAGQAIFQGDGTSTVESANGLRSRAQNSWVTVIYSDTDEWSISGDTTV